MESILAIVVPVVLVILALKLLLTPMKIIWKLALNSLSGFICLWLLNLVSGITGIVCNLLLFAGKLIMGLLSGALSVVADAINAWASQLTAAEVVDKINAAGIPAAVVYNFADIEADENFTVHRQMIKKMHHPEMGEILYINNPLRFTESGQREAVPAAPLGAYNEEIYGQYLGMSPAEVAQLKENGTI